jgi:hypothetical protein
MKSALITAAIIIGIVGSILFFERKKTDDRLPEENPEKWLLEKIEEKREAEDVVQKVLADSPESISKLIQMASDPASATRSEAARELAKSGKTEVIEVIKKALSDKDDDVQDSALWGIRDAFAEDPFRDQKTSREFKEGLFDNVAALLKHDFVVGKFEEKHYGDNYNREEAAILLPQMNKAKAAELLQTPEILRITNPDFDAILQALSDSGIPVNKDVSPWLDELRPKALAGEPPFQRFYGQLIRAAATQKHPKIHEIIQDGLNNFKDWRADNIPENAAEAQWIALGLSPTLDDDISIFVEIEGFDKLERPVQHYSAVSDYYYDGMNGGMSQYFLNSYSNRARLALEAVTAMDAVADAYALSEAMKKFGKDGPPLEQTARRALMYANNSRLFDVLDGIKVPESISQKYSAIIYAKLYPAKYVEVFKRIPRTHP